MAVNIVYLLYQLSFWAIYIQFTHFFQQRKGVWKGSFFLTSLTAQFEMLATTMC